ncbi:kinase-like domain-containing protein [Mycena galopus ATCC 62051]|nr:kinase-like domain-containing protein [Mycena galopus ATCC 62051]
MFALILYVVSCISVLVSQADNIRCRALSAAQRTVDGAVFVVVGALKSKKTQVQLPPPPTKTLPFWTPPNETALTQPPPAMFLSLGFYCIVIIVAIIAALVRMHLIEIGVIKVARKFVHRCKTTFLVVVVCLSLLAWEASKLCYPQEAKYIGSTNNIVTVILNMYDGIIRVYLNNVAGAIDFTPLIPLGHGLDAVLPGSRCMLHPELPWYDQQLDAALPGLHSLLDVFNFPGRWRSINGLGVKQTVAFAELAFIKKLGSGAFGQVMEMKSADNIRRFAVKKTRKVNLANGRPTWGSLCSEVDVHVRMQDHPAFPSLHGLFHDRSYFYMVMDLGEASFADIMMPMRRSALSYGTELLHALHGLHAQGIVHLDVKPANLVLGKDGELLVIDYGLSRRFNMEEPKVADFPEWSWLRRKGDRRFPLLWPTPENPHLFHVSGGTPGYVSPPVLLNQACSYGADIWAFGMVFYEWITKDFPTFDDDGMTWVPNMEHRLSNVDIDFFRKIFSYTRPLRFENWFEVENHPIWNSCVSRLRLRFQPIHFPFSVDTASA